MRYVRRCVLSCVSGESKRIVLGQDDALCCCFESWPHLSRKWICANFRWVAAPIFERRAGIDLQVLVADLARNVILPIVAVAFAAPSPVNEPHFSRVIDLIQRRTDRLTGQIFSIGRSHLRSRIGSDDWLPDGRGSDIARSQIRHWK